MRLKKGTIREDGMIFWGYHSTGKEYWVVPEQYAHKLEKRRVSTAAIKTAHAKHLAEKGYPCIKFKQGTIRNDGMIFWGYQCTGKEYWVLPEKYAYSLEKRRARMTKKYHETLEASRLKNVKYHAKNRARLLAVKALDRATNPEKWRARRKAYYAIPDNRKKRAESHSVWMKANRDKCRATVARQKAARMAATPPDTIPKLTDGVYAIAARVSKCLGIPHDVDHIVPLALGGSHCHRNLQVLPARWNRRKQAHYDYPLPDCYRTDGWMIV